ncbi:MAG: hypothetical protein KDD46_09030, partial [Bdellovibrionales bacterium]|nr:hypothetical protein [Bdellovibrionales bacterium]
ANFFFFIYDNYGGVLSGIVSFFAWIFIWGVYLILIEINFFSQNPGTEIEKNNLEDTSREV